VSPRKKQRLVDPDVQQALGVVARRAKDLGLHERLGARVGYPLEGPYYGTLSRLATTGTATVSELAELLNLELSTVSRRVRVLEDRHLIEREPGTDRRTSHLRLTPEGKQMFHALEQGWREMLSEIVADWPDEDVDRFSELFTRFAADFERYALASAAGGAVGPRETDASRTPAGTVAHRSGTRASSARPVAAGRSRNV
jgi:DNA-binding MarR family transcriptional regulator